MTYLITIICYFSPERTVLAYLFVNGQLIMHFISSGYIIAFRGFLTFSVIVLRFLINLSCFTQFLNVAITLHLSFYSPLKCLNKATVIIRKRPKMLNGINYHFSGITVVAQPLLRFMLIIVLILAGFVSAFPKQQQMYTTCSK